MSGPYNLGDRNLRREKIEGVIEREYWVGPTSDPAIPQEIMDLIGPYKTYRVA